MTDAELEDSIARILKVDAALIRAEVRIYRQQGIAKLYARTKPYWIKARGEMDLVAGDYLINLKDYFPDLWQLRHLYTAEGKLEIMSEGKFRSLHYDDTATGTASTCVALDSDYIQLYPRPDAAMTFYVNYFYAPSQESIGGIPDQWQHVIQDYVLAMIWPKTQDRVTMLQFFERGLQDVAAMAKPVTEDDIDILENPFNATLYDYMKAER